eukprot:scaffold101102_cov27-Prasinocladus_malaysianus.AAC.1
MEDAVLDLLSPLGRALLGGRRRLQSASVSMVVPDILTTSGADGVGAALVFGVGLVSRESFSLSSSSMQSAVLACLCIPRLLKCLS